MLKPRENLSITLGVRLDRGEIRSVGFEPFDPEAEAAEFARRLPDGFIWEWERILLAKDVFTAYEGMGDFTRSVAKTLGLSQDAVTGVMSAVANMSLDWYHKRRADDIVLANVDPAPRLSISWDPWSDGKTKISATAGRYYGAIFLGVPAVEIGPATTTVTLAGERPVGFDTWGSVELAGGLNPAVSVRMVDRGLRTPHQDEFTLAFEREVLPETSLRVQWVRRRFEDQLQTQDVNHYVYDYYGSCNPKSPYRLVPTGSSTTAWGP